MAPGRPKSKNTPSSAFTETDPQSCPILIQPFQGDPELLDFFISQVQDLANLKKWSPQEHLLFLRSKLAGPALDFLVKDRQIATIKTVGELQDALRKFFRPPSQLASISELHSISLLMDESIMNFAHRINALVGRVYPELADPKALNDIKLVILNKGLPHDLRTKILSENIKDFDLAVEKAQNWMDSIAISNQMSLSNQTPLQAEILSLQVELKNLKNQLAERELSSNSCHHLTENNPPSASVNQNRVICQFCDNPGHTAKACFRIKRQKQRYAPNFRVNRARLQNYANPNANGRL